MRIVFFGLLFTLFLPISRSEHSVKDTARIDRNNFKLGLTPSAVLNFYPAAQLCGEVRIYKRLYGNLDAGYIFDSFIDYKLVSGYRFRPGISFKLIDAKDFNLYFGTHYTFRKVNIYKDHALRRANGAYTEHITDKSTINFEFFTLSLLGDFPIAKNFGVKVGGFLGAGKGYITSSNEEIRQIEARYNTWFSGEGESLTMLVMSLNVLMYYTF